MPCLGDISVILLLSANPEPLKLVPEKLNIDLLLYPQKSVLQVAPDRVAEERILNLAYTFIRCVAI